MDGQTGLVSQVLGQGLLVRTEVPAAFLSAYLDDANHLALHEHWNEQQRPGGCTAVLVDSGKRTARGIRHHQLRAVMEAGCHTCFAAAAGRVERKGNRGSFQIRLHFIERLRTTAVHVEPHPRDAEQARQRRPDSFQDLGGRGKAGNLFAEFVHGGEQ